ncbi:hypothetical protein AB1N83_012181 [Pleurotus pulmonarius]
MPIGGISMMGQYYKFINFDKRQVHGSLGKFGEFTGNGLVKVLIAPQLYPALDVAFKSIFIGYDLSTATSFLKAGLGRLGKLPVELLTYIFEYSDLDGAAMLGATHAQLFVIGYASIVQKIEDIALFNNWAFERIICVGDYATTLPAGFLSTAEKHRLMTWGIKHKAILDEHGDAPLDDIVEYSAPNSTTDSAEEGTPDVRDIELAKALAAYEDQSFYLYSYGCKMPSLYGMARSRMCSPTLSYDLEARCRVVPMDRRCISRLDAALVRFNPYSMYNDLGDAVLVNTTKREFVRAVDDEGKWVLDAAIPLLTVWGADEYAERVKREGAWAGDRLAIVSEEDLEELMEEEDGWTERKQKWEDV